jgi:hypothetical protein
VSYTLQLNPELATPDLINDNVEELRDSDWEALQPPPPEPTKKKKEKKAKEVKKPLSIAVSELRSPEARSCALPEYIPEWGGGSKIGGGQAQAILYRIRQVLSVYTSREVRRHSREVV